MSALVWNSPLSRSALPPPASRAVICRLSATSDPPATLGVPPTPPALPRATTAWPTATFDESASWAVFRPKAPCNWMSATSALGS